MVGRTENGAWGQTNVLKMTALGDVNKLYVDLSCMGTDTCLLICYPRCLLHVEGVGDYHGGASKMSMSIQDGLLCCGDCHASTNTGGTSLSI